LSSYTVVPFFLLLPFLHSVSPPLSQALIAAIGLALAVGVLYYGLALVRIIKDGASVDKKEVEKRTKKVPFFLFLPAPSFDYFPPTFVSSP